MTDWLTRQDLHARARDLFVLAALVQIAYAADQYFGYDVLWNAASAPYRIDRQLPGTIGHGNWLGVFLAMVGPLAPAAAIPVFVGGLLLAQSRLGLVALAVGLLVKYGLRERRFVSEQAGQALVFGERAERESIGQFFSRHASQAPARVVHNDVTARRNAPDKRHAAVEAKKITLTDRLHGLPVLSMAAARRAGEAVVAVVLGALVGLRSSQRADDRLDARVTGRTVRRHGRNAITLATFCALVALAWWMPKSMSNITARWIIAMLGFDIWRFTGGYLGVLVGLGPGTWWLYVPSAQETFGILRGVSFTPAHNEPMQFVFEQGIVGLLLVGRLLWSYRRAFQGPYAGALASLAVTTLGMFPFHLAQLAVPALVLVGLATANHPGAKE